MPNPIYTPWGRYRFGIGIHSDSIGVFVTKMSKVNNNKNEVAKMWLMTLTRHKGLRLICSCKDLERGLHTPIFTIPRYVNRGSYR